MLTTSSNLLVFHMLRDGLQDELLHYFSRDGDEAEWPAVSQALHALLKTEVTSAYFLNHPS